MLPISRRMAILILGGRLSAPLFAQTDLPALPVAQLNKPAGWQLAGSILPGSGNTLKTKSGNDLLVGSGSPLTLATPNADFQMRFEMLATPNAEVSLQLPTGQPILFGRDQDVVRLLKASGLWQTVELSYKTGQNNQPAALEKLVLNGVTVREGEFLPGNPNGSVVISSPGGTVAIRRVGYRVLTPRTVARWSGPLSYTLYEGESNKRDNLPNQKILKQDTTSMLDYEVAAGQAPRYTMLFAGKLNALQPGSYQFDLRTGGMAGLWIDEKNVIREVNHNLDQSATSTVELTAGLHDVIVYYSKPQRRVGLGLFVSQAGTRPQPLHALSSLPDPTPVPLISVVPEVQAERVRSFVQLPGEKHKRTHSLSVGSPMGYHYTVDLDQMALLQVWKGDFADVTEMWHERGEPQLLEPMGTTLRLPAQTGLMVLNNDGAAWPDSVDEKTLHYNGLSVDKQGNPTLRYTLAGAAVTDVTQPTRDGLTRTLTMTGAPNGPVYCRVAAGQTIDDMGNGLYAINDRRYFVRLDPKARVKQRQSNGKQELLLPVSLKNGSGSVAYSVVF